MDAYTPATHICMYMQTCMCMHTHINIYSYFHIQNHELIVISFISNQHNKIHLSPPFPYLHIPVSDKPLSKIYLLICQSRIYGKLFQLLCSHPSVLCCSYIIHWMWLVALFLFAFLVLSLNCCLLQSLCLDM